MKSKSKLAVAKAMASKPAETTIWIEGSKRNSGKYSTVTFGSAKVQGAQPAKSIVNRNIKAGQYALKRAATTIAKPGVRLGAGKTIPLFHADPQTPGQLVRVLNGKHEKVILSRSGKFLVRG